MDFGGAKVWLKIVECKWLLNIEWIWRKRKDYASPEAATLSRLCLAKDTDARDTDARDIDARDTDASRRQSAERKAC